MGRQSMLHNLNKMLEVTTDDGRHMTGKLLVYDRHMNVVLGDTKEERPQTAKMVREGVEATRDLGLILLRGEHVVSVTLLPGQESSEATRYKMEKKTGGFRGAPKLKTAGAMKRPRVEEEDA